MRKDQSAMRSNQRAVIDPSLVDFDVLADWMDAQGLPSGPFEQVRVLAGGTQNVLVRLARGGERYVLRRGPQHLRPKSNDVMRREMQVLAALAGSDVPHPRFIAGCQDETLMGGAVFYLMEPIDGFNATVELPEPHASDPSIRHEMGLQAAEAVARLGAVDHVAVGLGDFGRPDGFLERQVSRWQNELASYSELDGYDGPAIPGLDEVAEWLDARRPTAWRPGILHGDYHLANVMYSPTGPQLVAIVDWEMSTIGDPLLDLGWLLATWPDADAPGIGAVAGFVAGTFGSASGLPSQDELLKRYAEVAPSPPRDLSSIAWYIVLACFKLGIVLEGTHARACAGKAPKATGDLLHTITLGLFARAHSVIAGD
jgi:aminoglycoside phosphotransferase (APT) family kinase protein